jgi:hypothetical protein
MSYYCWRCRSNITEMDPLLHHGLHEALDDIRAYGTATMKLEVNGKPVNVEIKPEPGPIDLTEYDKRKVHTFKEDEKKNVR